ncbi:MAG: hypothetical protein HYR91_13270 [Flavobacteriia bacterium]|nr:hypothetical protein [Flavobacteriia bacterium]
MKIIFTVVCISLFVQINAQTKKYYRNAFMDVFGMCKGMYPITEEEAYTMNYYVFEYDTINRLYDVKSCKMEDEIGVFSDVLNGIRLSYSYKENEIVIQSYNFGEDLENIYEPNLFYWQAYLDSKKNISAIGTFEISEYDSEFFEETSRISYIYNTKGALDSIYVKGSNPFYFEEDKEKKVNVKLNSLNQLTLENNDYLIEVEKNDLLRLESNYDSIGNLISRKAYNLNNELIKLNESVCYFENSYDQNGYLKSMTSYNCDGNKVNSKIVESDTEVVFPCEIINNYDFRGNLLDVKYYNFNSEPFLVDGTIFNIKYEYDSLNNLISQFNYGENLTPVLDKFGFSGYRFKFHEIGRMSERSYFGANQLPVNNNFGVHKIIYEFDSYDFTNAEIYFSENNEPVEDYSGAHRYEFEYYYDEEGYGKTITKAYAKDSVFLGTDEIISEDGNEYKYRKNTIDNYVTINESWFDINSKPILNDLGFHKANYSYSTDESLIEDSYFDVNNALVVVPSRGYARRKMDLIENTSLQKEVRYYGELNQLILNLDSVAVVKFFYDSLNQLVEKIQLNQFEKPTELLTVFYKETNKYDSSGNLIEVNYFNSLGKLFEDKFGFATYKFLYNGNYLQEKSFYSKKKKLKVDKKGVAIYTYLYDINGNLIEEHYRDSKNKPCETNDSVGVLKIDYYESGAVQRITAFNLKGCLVDTMLDGHFCAKVEFFYDDPEIEVVSKYYNKQNMIIE